MANIQRNNTLHSKIQTYLMLNQKLPQIRNKFLYFLLSGKVVLLVYASVRCVQNDLRPDNSTFFLNSYPSFAFASGLSPIAWILLRKPFLKALRFPFRDPWLMNYCGGLMMAFLLTWLTFSFWLSDSFLPHSISSSC